MPVVLSAAKDPRICFQANTEMLRFAQHDRSAFFSTLVGLPARGVNWNRRPEEPALSRAKDLPQPAINGRTSLNEDCKIL
jgi:hypothetical protein